MEYSRVEKKRKVLILAIEKKTEIWLCLGLYVSGQGRAWTKRNVVASLYPHHFEWQPEGHQTYDCQVVTTLS